MMSKKLFQINVTANWGSTGKIAESIGIAAMKAGWESYVAFGRWCNPSQSHLIKIGGCCDKYLHYAEQRIRDNEGLCSRNATRRLLRQINMINPDVVQLHNIHDHYLNYNILFEYLNLTNIKVVWTFHDCWAFTGHCFHFVTADCDRWKNKCFDCPMRKINPKTVLDRASRNYELKQKLFNRCMNLTIVSCSDWMAGLVRESFLKNKRIEVIKNGIDTNIFRPVDLEKENNNQIFDILAVSSVWNEDKGLYDIYKLREALPEEYRITIVGLTANQLATLPAGIVGIERTQDVKDLVRLYSNANVLINPTYADTFPTVNLEALSCGTPVITYRTGGSPESIDEETGVVVEQGDIEAVVSAINRFTQLDRYNLSISCRERALKLFDAKNTFAQYISLYNMLAKG